MQNSLLLPLILAFHFQPSRQLGDLAAVSLGLLEFVRRRRIYLTAPGKFLLHHWDSVSDLHLVNLFPNGYYNLLQSVFNGLISQTNRFCYCISYIALVQ